MLPNLTRCLSTSENKKCSYPGNDLFGFIEGLQYKRKHFLLISTNSPEQNWMSAPDETARLLNEVTLTDLGAVQTDDPVHIPCAVVEVRHGNCVLAGGDPVLLCVWVNLEDVSSSAEDRLFPVGQKKKDDNMTAGGSTAPDRAM